MDDKIQTAKFRCENATTTGPKANLTFCKWSLIVGELIAAFCMLIGVVVVESSPVYVCVGRATSDTRRTFKFNSSHHDKVGFGYSDHPTHTIYSRWLTTYRHLS